MNPTMERTIDMTENRECIVCKDVLLIHLFANHYLGSIIQSHDYERMIRILYRQRAAAAQNNKASSRPRSYYVLDVLIHFFVTITRKKASRPRRVAGRIQYHRSGSSRFDRP
eukprot:scaffold63190_cov53-Attheya_sp.AAC.4